MKPIRVLLLLPYAWDTVPGQRFRIEQWHPWLAEHGVQFTIRTLLSQEQQRLLYSSGQAARKALMMAGCMLQRVIQLRNLRRFDVIWLYRAAWPVGPALLERFMARTGVPVIVEFDDAIFLTDTTAENRRWGFLKCAGKTDEICQLSSHVVVGNPYLADYSRRFNPNVTVIPTTIDTDTYPARAEYTEPSTVVVGWSGSKTTVAHLSTVNEAIRKVASQASVRLHVVGTPEYRLEGVETYAAPWSSSTEVGELSRFDLGIMPLPDDEWARGKCGLKALQYMAMGIPTIVSPVGVNTEIISEGRNGLLASTQEEWCEQMLALVRDRRLRERLGRAGRQTVETTYSTLTQAPRVLELLQQLAGRVPAGTRSHRVAPAETA